MRSCKLLLVCALAFHLISGITNLAGANDCPLTTPPTYLNDIFAMYEGSPYTNYRTRTMTEDVDFEIEEEYAALVGRVFTNSVTMQRVTFSTEFYEENPTPAECE